MKFKVSKKLIVSSLASVMAVSLVGAVTGTVAWYQYNTRVTTSLIGMNVAETGVLEISATSATAGYRADLVTADLGLASTRITPVTFNNDANQTATGVLPTNAYKNPNHAKNRVAKDAGVGHAAGSYADVYTAASTSTASEAGYIQYTVYIRGKTVDNVTGGFTQTAEEVKLLDLTLNEVDSGSITEGMRIHLACYDDSASGTADRNFLLSKTAKTELPLFGKLDLDGDGVADRLGGYEWLTDRDDVVTYGKDGVTQSTQAISALVAANTTIVTTPAVADHASKIVITVWLEGWDYAVGSQTIKNVTATKPAADTDVSSGYYTDRNATVSATGTADGNTVYYQSQNVTNVPMWSGLNTDGAYFNLGITFGVADDAFAD